MSQTAFVCQKYQLSNINKKNTCQRKIKNSWSPDLENCFFRFFFWSLYSYPNNPIDIVSGVFRLSHPPSNSHPLLFFGVVYVFFL